LLHAHAGHFNFRQFGHLSSLVIGVIALRLAPPDYDATDASSAKA